MVYIVGGVLIHSMNAPMLKNTNIYFTGKVLNVRELASDNAKSFRFNKQERDALDLKGLPIRLEHEDNLTVGTIQHSWNKNNEHWVFGKIDQSSIPATFAKYALMKTGTDKPYYTGLSLQHVHREYPDGKTEKKGIEVSLTTDPRRPNCNITWTSANAKAATNNKTYKLVSQLASTKAVAKIKTEMASVTEAAPQQTEVPAEPSAPTGQELSEKVYDEMAKLMEKEQAQQSRIAELEQKLQEHNKHVEAEKAKKAQEDAAKGKALMATFLEHVKELVGDHEGLQQTVEPMIAANPEGMGRVMEIVSKASKKYAENSLALRKAEANLKDKELELKFQQLIQSKSLNMQTATPVVQQVEVASKKRAPQEPVQQAAKVVAQKAINPYASRKAPVQRRQVRKVGGMNTDLLKAYNATRGDGLSAMSKLHKSLSERRRSYY